MGDLLPGSTRGKLVERISYFRGQQDRLPLATNSKPVIDAYASEDNVTCIAEVQTKGNPPLPCKTSSSIAPSARFCRCGSSDHMRISHSSCRLNPAAARVRRLVFLKQREICPLSPEPKRKLAPAEPGSKQSLSDKAESQTQPGCLLKHGLSSRFLILGFFLFLTSLCEHILLATTRDEQPQLTRSRYRASSLREEYSMFHQCRHSGRSHLWAPAAKRTQGLFECVVSPHDVM